MKGKLLILANKRLDNNLHYEALSYIHSFDKIVRINGMNNFYQTGERTDYWWVNVWNKDVILENVGDTDYSSVSKIFLDIATQNLCSDKWFKEAFNKLNTSVEFIKTECHNNKTIENINDYTKLDWWSQDPNDKNIPTTFIICVSYFLKHYSDKYDIYIALCDIDNLDELYKTNPIWNEYWHCNSGAYIERYIKDNINKGKLYYIDLENYGKDIHNS